MSRLRNRIAWHVAGLALAIGVGVHPSPLHALGTSQSRVLTANAYTTSFPKDENPFSEGGLWNVGHRHGQDWSDVRVSGGKALSTQTASNGPPYDDAVAILRGTWGATQTVTGTVFMQNPTTATFEEVELWVRASIGQRSIIGYETAFRTTNDGSQYIGIVKWLGPLGQTGCITDCAFTQLGVNCDGGNGFAVGVHNGDTLSVTVSGTSTVTITAFVNGVQQCQRTDSSSPYQGGNPGLGVWLRVNGSGSNNDYGWTSFTATAS